jgi:uncharacterized Zn-finger protein
LRARCDVPLIRVGFPIHDRIGGQRVLHLGYRGAQELYDRIVNALLEAKQDTSTIGYSRLRLSMNTTAGIDFNNHPCFSKEAHKKYGRVHLPVAPRCNIQCNFCNRKYDCINESRPGVTSTVLTPPQALAYLDNVMAKRRPESASWASPGRAIRSPIPRRRWKRSGSSAKNIPS